MSAPVTPIKDHAVGAAVESRATVSDAQSVSPDATAPLIERVASLHLAEDGATTTAAATAAAAAASSDAAAAAVVSAATATASGPVHASVSLTAAPVLPASAVTSTTGLVYDPRCLLHQANYAHVEQPKRVSDTMRLLVSSGAYARCVHVPTRRVLDSELIDGGAATAEHVALIDASAHDSYGPDEPDSETEGDDTLYPDCKFLDSDTYVNRHSAEAARFSIGGLLNLVEAVLQGEVRNGFAVIRPPGHHADAVKASGFCLYNNVAVAVKALRAKYPEQLRRVLIVDWDVHHGNGTERIFYDDPAVLYFSIHRYQGGAFYPHTGGASETGGVGAPGSNINVPLNYQSLGDAEYLEVFRTLLLPVIGEFAPDLIMVSAGFDCAQGDPLGGMDVSSEGFAAMTRLLMDSVAHGRVVLALEGGYNVRAVSEAVLACTQVLLGDEVPEMCDPHAFMGPRERVKIAARKDNFRRDLAECVKIQKKFWKCLESGAQTTSAATETTAKPNVAVGAPAAASGSLA